MAQTLTIKRGDNKTIYVETPDLTITGGTILFTVKTKAQLDPVDLTDTSAVLKKTGTVTGANTARFDLVPGDTQNLIGGTYYYDVQVTIAGVVTTIFDTTKCIIKSDVTQRTS